MPHALCPLPSLGSKRKAANIARRAYKSVPAYQDFLAARGANIRASFDELPPLDKKSYILAYPFDRLLGDDADRILAFFRSSGSSGNPVCWPYLRSGSRFAALATRLFLERSFAIHQQKTLAIVALSLGSCSPGVQFASSLNSMNAKLPYPFWLFAPGKNLPEIIEAIANIQHLVEQIILFIVPSAIAHLHLLAEQLQKPLPLEKLRYIALGEPFPESLRTGLQQHAGIAENVPFMFSMYGSTDTGGLGVESLATVALRQLLTRHPSLAERLGIDLPIPLFFHSIAVDAFLETLDGSLCITRWQGIPLVRYLLGDRVAFYNWRKLKTAILTAADFSPADEPLVQIISRASNWLPNLIAVTGRSDSCLILGGTNLTEYMLDEAVKSEALQDILTGLYRARIVYQQERQYLAFDLETRPDVRVNEEIDRRVYRSLIDSLGELEPFFSIDWQNIYSHWDNHRDLRVLKLNFLPWPSLSQLTEATIKQRGISS
jgi:phenylacetate-CoA ligase